METKNTTFNMRLSTKQDEMLKDNSKLLYGNEKSKTKYLIDLIEKDNKRIKRTKK